MRKELEKIKHDLEIELDDFKEESKISQPVNDSELRVWNDKIHKKQELVNAEQDNEKKNKENFDKIQKENEKLHGDLGNIDNLSNPKLSGNELKKVREGIEIAERNIKICSKKNKDLIREKENEVLTSKNELNLLIDKVGELNKIYRINQYRYSQNDRIIKYNLYEVRGESDSHLDLTYNSKTGSSRGVMNKNRGHHLSGKENFTSKRERSAINTRNPNKKDPNFNSGYLNNSDISGGIGRYQGNSKNQGNRFKTMKKMNEKVNSSMTYGDKSKNKIDLIGSKQDMTLDNIKIEKNQDKKKFKDTTKYDKKSKDTINEKNKINEAPKENLEEDEDDFGEYESKHSKKNSEIKETKELHEVKGLKVGQKKKIRLRFMIKLN